MKQKEAQRSAFEMVVARAWGDLSFKAKLLADPTSALATLGAAVPAGMTVKVVENVENLDYLVLPVQPAGELSDEKVAEATGIRLQGVAGGNPVFMPFCSWCPFCLDLVRKAWSDPAFKAKLLADPYAAIEAAGADVREGETIRVLENTDKLIHLVLPLQPAGELSDEALDAAVGAVGDEGTAACWIART